MESLSETTPHPSNKSDRTGFICLGFFFVMELLPLSTMRSLLLYTKGKIYAICLRNVMLYKSENWPLMEETEMDEDTDGQMEFWGFPK